MISMSLVRRIFHQYHRLVRFSGCRRASFCFVTLASVALQLHAEPAYRGRIMALWVFVFIGTAPIGSIVVGWIAGTSGPRWALAVGALAAIVAAVGAGFVRTPSRVDDEFGAS